MYIFISRYLSFTVHRVHWLHACAQLMRWQEEVTLTTYEMQWTVRYFRYRSQSWRLPEGTRTESIRSSSGTGTGKFRDTGMDTGISTTKTLDPKLTTGTIAYQR